MFIKSDFTINGISSSALGVTGAIIVRTDNTPLSSPMMGTRSIKKQKSLKNNRPTPTGIEQDVIEFDLKIAFSKLEAFTVANRMTLAKHFTKTEYVPFTSSEYPGVVFYVIATSMNMIRNGELKGWFDIHLETSAPYAFLTPTTQVFDLHDIVESTNITIVNLSNVMNRKYGAYIYEPKLTVQLSGASTSFILKNRSNNDEIFSLTELVAGETLIIENEYNRITSTVSDARISHLVNRNWFKLVEGENSIQVYNPLILTVDCLFPVYV